MINIMIMKVLLAHQTLGIGNRINVNMIRVWHKLLKFGWIILTLLQNVY